MNSKIITLAGYFAMTGWTFNIAFLLVTALKSYRTSINKTNFWFISMVMLSSPFFCVYIAIPMVSRKIKRILSEE